MTSFASRRPRLVGHGAPVLVAFALMLAACSTGDGASIDTTNDTTNDTTDDTTDDTGPGTVVGGGPGAAVQPYQEFGDCDAFLGWTKERMLERVGPYGLDGGGYWRGEDGDFVTAPAATDAPSDDSGRAPDTAVTGEGTGGTSTTNTQEAGVDEGDLTETDGRFVYSVIDHTLRSVDLATQTLLTEEAVPQGEHQMILSGDRLLLVTQSWTGAASDTVAAIYEVADGVLTLAGRSHLEGYVLATRAIDGTARIVLRAGLTDRVPFVYPRRGTEESEAQALEENTAVIQAIEAEDLLPRAFTVGPEGDRSPLVAALDCAAMGHPGDFSGFGLTWVATIDMAAEEPVVQGTSGLVADAQTVYASSTTMYVATVRYDDSFGETVPVVPEPPHTDLHAFDLADAAGSAYLASGSVDGTVLNQYSLSEYEDHLRVATTTQGFGFGEEQASGVHVFERDDSELVEVGAVTGLGVTEQIQAVRFLGDRGYVVTFRQVDPLYVLDLSDPAHPTLEGELKIPGFSTYLHPIGEGRVLAVGYSATDQGAVTGTQLSLFDVADASDPKLLDTLEVGETTEAAFDPHAFLWWAETGTVVVPRELVCVRAAGPGCESAVVAQVVGDDLVEQGRLFHWFPIRRSMVASGDLVTVSAGGLRAHDLSTLAELADVRFDIPGTTAEDDLP